MEKEPFYYEASFQSDTLFRAFQRDTKRKKDSSVLPLYEYLRLDVDAPDPGWSLHTFGWGRHDFGGNDYFKDNPDGELLYGYLQYNRPDFGVDVKIGRQHIFKGAINDSIDGLGVEGLLTPYFDYAIYGGSPVSLSEEEGRSGDSFLGGRISGHIGAGYELGVSYRLENSNSEKDGEMMGFDVFLPLLREAYISGSTVYNRETSGWGQVFVEAGLDVGNFHFRPVYERYQYEDFFNSGDNSADPFRFLAGTGEILTAAGSDVLWKGFSTVDLGAKVRSYNYDLRNEESYYGEGNVTWYLNAFSQAGAQIGRMDGGTADTAYYMARAYLYLNRPMESSVLEFVTGDIVYVHYDEEIFEKDSSIFLSLGTGKSFFNDTLVVKVSGDLSQNPYFDSDMRAMLTITYRKDIQETIGGGQ